MRTLWVRVVFNPNMEGGEGAWCPDVPLGPGGLPAVGYRAEIPVDIAPPRGNPARGRPLVQRCRIVVSDADAARIEAAGKVVAPSDDDLAIIEACTIPDDPADRRYRHGQKARERFRALAERGVSKDTLKRALTEAVRRGVRLQDAEAITDELRLGNDTTSSGR